MAMVRYCFHCEQFFPVSFLQKLLHPSLSDLNLSFGDACCLFCSSLFVRIWSDCWWFIWTFSVSHTQLCLPIFFRNYSANFFFKMSFNFRWRKRPENLFSLYVDIGVDAWLQRLWHSTFPFLFMCLLCFAYCCSCTI